MSGVLISVSQHGWQKESYTKVIKNTKITKKEYGASRELKARVARIRIFFAIFACFVIFVLENGSQDPRADLRALRHLRLKLLLRALRVSALNFLLSTRQ